MSRADRLFRLLLLAAGLPALYGQPVRFRTQILPWAIVGSAYTVPVETVVNGHCPVPDVSLALAAGRLPDGLDIQGGSLAGIPGETGAFRFSLRAQNTCAAATREFELFVTGKPVLKVVPETLVFDCHAGDAAPAPQTVLVSSSWPNLPYSVSGGATQWLNPQQTRGATPPKGSPLTSDTVSVQVDPHTLAPGLYESPMVVSTWMGANAPVVRVTIRVVP